jgi:hypothetical protein
MKSMKIIAVITLTVIAVALIGTAALASAYNPYRSMTPNTSPRRGMMNGWSSERVNNQNPFQTNTQSRNGGWGGNCHNYGRGYAVGSYASNTGKSIILKQAVEIAQQYVTSINNPDLKVAEVEEYTNDFYVQVHEISTGTGAFELIIDKYSGNIYPEMGPNMMWNTKYITHRGMMGFYTGLKGMMGFQRTTSIPMTLNAEHAEVNAKQFLNQYYVDATVGHVKAFYGYYHVEVLSDGEVFGMLSVNGYSGEVWFHNWHGSFIQNIIIT